MDVFIRALGGDQAIPDEILPDDINFKELDWIIVILKNLSDSALEAIGDVVQKMVEELDYVGV